MVEYPLGFRGDTIRLAGNSMLVMEGACASSRAQFHSLCFAQIFTTQPTMGQSDPLMGSWSDGLIMLFRSLRMLV